MEKIVLSILYVIMICSFHVYSQNVKTGSVNDIVLNLTLSDTIVEWKELDSIKFQLSLSNNSNKKVIFYTDGFRIGNRIDDFINSNCYLEIYYTSDLTKEYINISEIDEYNTSVSYSIDEFDNKIYLLPNSIYKSGNLSFGAFYRSFFLKKGYYRIRCITSPDLNSEISNWVELELR